MSPDYKKREFQAESDLNSVLDMADQEEETSKNALESMENTEKLIESNTLDSFKTRILNVEYC